DKLGGLAAIYLLGFLIVTLNTYLCYRLLRVRMPIAAAAAGAGAFFLFAAGTTKIFLTHDFQFQPSLPFALVSALAYAADRRLLGYIVGGCALLAYENGFLALLAVPLFVRPWSRSLPRELLRHILTLVGIVLLVVVARFATGEPRASES